MLLYNTYGLRIFWNIAVRFEWSSSFLFSPWRSLVWVVSGDPWTDLSKRVGVVHVAKQSECSHSRIMFHFLRNWPLDRCEFIGGPVGKPRPSLKSCVYVKNHKIIASLVTNGWAEVCWADARRENATTTNRKAFIVVMIWERLTESQSG